MKCHEANLRNLKEMSLISEKKFKILSATVFNLITKMLA